MLRRAVSQQSSASRPRDNFPRRRIHLSPLCAELLSQGAAKSDIWRYTVDKKITLVRDATMRRVTKAISKGTRKFTSALRIRQRQGAPPLDRKWNLVTTAATTTSTLCITVTQWITIVLFIGDVCLVPSSERRRGQHSTVLLVLRITSTGILTAGRTTSHRKRTSCQAERGEVTNRSLQRAVVRCSADWRRRHHCPATPGSLVDGVTNIIIIIATIIIIIIMLFLILDSTCMLMRTDGIAMTTRP